MKFNSIKMSKQENESLHFLALSLFLVSVFVFSHPSESREQCKPLFSEISYSLPGLPTEFKPRLSSNLEHVVANAFDAGKIPSNPSDGSLHSVLNLLSAIDSFPIKIRGETLNKTFHALSEQGLLNFLSVNDPRRYKLQKSFGIKARVVDIADGVQISDVIKDLSEANPSSLMLLRIRDTQDNSETKSSYIIKLGQDENVEYMNVLASQIPSNELYAQIQNGVLTFPIQGPFAHSSGPHQFLRKSYSIEQIVLLSDVKK